MPTRKQRRRRQKDRRHEYEYVLVDDEGRELDADDLPAGNGAQPKSGRAAKDTPKRAASARSMREVPPPSLRRLGKRALIVTPLMFATVYFLNGEETRTIAQDVWTTFVLLAMFLPFSYALDAITYRTWRRRAERDAADGATKRKR